jgi:hypothetical protein
MFGWRSGNRSTVVRGLVRGFDKNKSSRRATAASVGSTGTGGGPAAGSTLPRARPSAAALSEPDCGPQPPNNRRATFMMELQV